MFLHCVTGVDVLVNLFCLQNLSAHALRVLEVACVVKLLLGLVLFPTEIALQQRVVRGEDVIAWQNKLLVIKRRTATRRANNHVNLEVLFLALQTKDMATRTNVHFRPLGELKMFSTLQAVPGGELKTWLGIDKHLVLRGE